MAAITATTFALPANIGTVVRHYPGHSGLQVDFPNGFGASIITTRHSGDRYEVAVLDADGSITYDTPITDDVIGYITAGQVESLLVEIAALPAD